MFKRYRLIQELKDLQRGLHRAYTLAEDLREGEIMQWLEVIDSTLVKVMGIIYMSTSALKTREIEFRHSS